jgi:hypothetical protein
MSGVPPRHQPFNFEMPLLGEGGKVHPAWQMSLNALKNRVEEAGSPVACSSTTRVANSPRGGLCESDTKSLRKRPQL